MKRRMWMWVGIALVVGVLVMAATRSGNAKDCGKAKKPTGSVGRWSSNRQADADYYGYDPEFGPAPPLASWAP